VNQPEREHPVLGRLKWDGSYDSWETEVNLTPGCLVSFRIVAEAEWAEADPDELFAIGADFLAWARGAEAACRERIADDYLEVYNQAWADDDPDEGPPPLDRAGFLAHLRLAGISLFHTGSSDWVYDPGDLFAGHGISVYAGADRVFGRASLFG
jgi:hypothetical protein